MNWTGKEGAVPLDILNKYICMSISTIYERIKENLYMTLFDFTPSGGQSLLTPTFYQHPVILDQNQTPMSRLTIKFYGTRGSIPVCHPDFLEFGGNTTCISMHRSDNGRISILDAGTGIRQLGKDINENFPEQNELFIAFSHFHWDHIQGFPFFDPAYRSDMKINILALGERRTFTDLHEIFAMQMQQMYFPVPLEKMGCSFNFLLDENRSISLNGGILKAIRQDHPGGSYGYRIELNDRVVVFCTDLEHGPSVNEKVVSFAAEADLLVHEAQYTSEELEKHRGWGHSSYDQALEVAERAEVKYLIMTHHDPEHDDVFLRKIEKQCQDRFPDCALAREGMRIEI